MAAPKYFRSTRGFRAWLAKHGASEVVLLVGFRKAATGLPSMTWSESVDEALCFGWIDGVRKRVDDERYTIRFSPRKPASNWSAINIAKVAKLRAEGRMTAAGEEAYARRTDTKSRPYSYEQSISEMLTAPELRAFRREKAAWMYFDAAPPSYRKVILHWITTAKQPETRAKRLEKTIAECAAERRLV